MQPTPAARTCLACQKPVYGRIDKKFCNDWCRNAYNNRDKSEAVNHIRNINNILKKNRRLLAATIMPQADTGKVSKAKLVEKGFSFRYFTHTHITKRGHQYFFCYEYGYLPIEDNFYLVVRQEVNG